MAMKNAVEVVVDGRVYKISGYESQEYLHQIAVYINEKMTECHSDGKLPETERRSAAADVEYEPGG